MKKSVQSNTCGTANTNQTNQNLDILLLSLEELRANAARDRRELEVLRGRDAERTTATASNDELVRVFQNLATSIENAVTTRTIRFEDIENSFKAFHGNGQIDITTWINHFVEQADLLNLSLKQRFSYAKRLMKGIAKLFIEHESKAKTWTELRTELTKEYGKKLNSAIVHQRLRERVKKPSESATEYLYQMMTVAGLGNIDEAAIVAYVIDGLPGSPVSKAFLYETETIAELKKKIKIYEQSLAKIKTNNERTQQDTAGKGKDRICFKCGQLGHYSAGCPNQDRESMNREAMKKPATSTGRINNIQKHDVEFNDEGSDWDNIQMSPSDEERMHKKLYFQFKNQ